MHVRESNLMKDAKCDSASLGSCWCDSQIQVFFLFLNITSIFKYKPKENVAML